MSMIPSNVSIGTVDLVTAAGNYNQYGTTSNVVNINDGRHYNIEVKAGGHSGVDLAAALDKLNARIAAGCMHNSAARVDAPKCHEDTRKAVQDDIFSWMSHGTADEVLWLTGPAGAGKSAIMGTVCDRLKESGQLAATFFFAAYLGRTTKQYFVTTLAYQLQRHPHVRERISEAMLAAICYDPAVFQMSLKEQVEILILQPLRSSRSLKTSNSALRMAIVIDGVDECGEATYGSSGRSRQDDQIEVLSVLLQANRDPSFPFRVIVASRPETWIRSYFTDIAQWRINEIFLDAKYSPDKDIRLFLKSKFTELCRRYGLDSSTWPTPEDLEILVMNASGQFIYAATVIRWIDTPGTSPQSQLQIVLKIKSQDSSSPFSLLDALYTSILRSSPSPETTVLWLKAIRLVTEFVYHIPSAWTVDRLFESNPGQARMHLGIPSLVHIPVGDPDGRTIDVSRYEVDLKVSPSLIPNVGWNAGYAFYHKSFLDYLNDRLRSGAAFPGIDQGKAEQWLRDRFTQTLKCGGPEVPIDPAFLLVFKRCLLDLLPSVISSVGLDTSDAFAGVQPSEWLAVHKTVPSTHASLDKTNVRWAFRSVHKRCRFYRPCSKGCKEWRKAISNLPSDEWNDGDWSSHNLLLDRFCIKRLE